MTNNATAPKLTVLVLAYQQERFIKCAVESAMAQDASDFDIILSDDASTDKTFEIMKSCTESYSGPHKIKCIRNSSNKGLNARLNNLVPMARSTHIMCISGDDISCPNRASKIIETFEKVSFPPKTVPKLA
ncbi:glycosyltransferase family A protein [uncultured Roseobacter sp.]|uniref:glycosyltransferase family 2 protein n=1 Tax=uncultured Roseobacter sp. TaxID=114847 RepID=UPI002623BBBC|nr:glycosyltransferase family A protein [uncultured Roseobacter sp.]